MSAFLRMVPRLVLGGLVLTWTTAGTAQEKKPEPPKVPAVAPIKPPENVADLRALEKQVQSVLEKVMPATVAVLVGPGQGSGVIVSAEGLVLTAGHVSMKPGENAIIVLPGGKRLKATTLGRNGGIDSGMVKIVDPGPYPFVDMGKSADLKLGQWCIAVGHPGGFRSNRAPVVRVGRILFASNSFLRTDATLVGGDSGGPLFDLNGKVIGIHSRIANAITENVHVPIDTYRQTWDRLVKGESWGGNIGQPSLVKSLGGKVILEEKGSITVTDARDSKLPDSYHKVFTVKMVPGQAYTIDLVSKNFDAFLRLEDSSGKQLAENDDGGGETNARLVYRPTREDTYRIFATTFEPGQTGAFTLTVRQAEILARDLPGGKVNVLQALRLPRQLAPQLFGQLAKSGMALHANAHLFDENGKPHANRELTFTWKNGKITSKTDDQGQVRLQLSREKIEDLVLNLPEGFRALLQLTDEEGNPPPIKLNLDKEKVRSAGGKVVLQKEAKLLPSDPRDKFLTGSTHHALTFKMVPGSVYTIDLESKEFDAYLRLEDASGKTLAMDDDSAGNLNARIVFRPTREEECRIVVTSFEAGQTGSYTLTIRQNETK